jgi:hypothetical protein
MERPMLNAIRSISSMPLSVFFEGKSAKTARYPGIKRTMGKAIMIRRALFILRSMRTNPMILQRKQKIIVLGYLSDSTRIIWD